MPKFVEQTDTTCTLTDPVNGETITSTRIPHFLRIHERYGPGLEYLQHHAGSMAVSLHLIEHVEASDLGVDFEEKLARHNTVAIEDNGWTEDHFDRLKALATGKSIEDILEDLHTHGDKYAALREAILDTSTYFSRLYRAIGRSGVNVCIGDIPHPSRGEYEDWVHYMWRQAHKNTFLPLDHQIAITLREWFMVANLGVHLREHDRPDAKILYVVGANHFLLQDKLMTFGILPTVEMPSGDGGLKAADDPTSKLFALRNVGVADMTGLDYNGKPITTS